jgi:predicted membrane-bound mannosyltransferase
VPLVAIVPLQVPDAVQLVALTDDHINVVEAPNTMEVAANVSVGAAGGGGAVTSKITGVAAAAPIALLQVSE